MTLPALTNRPARPIILCVPPKDVFRVRVGALSIPAAFFAPGGGAFLAPLFASGGPVRAGVVRSAPGPTPSSASPPVAARLVRRPPSDMYPYITVFGLRVGTYGLWMLAGLFAAFFLLVRLFRRREICWECALVVLCCAFGLALLGGYVFYLLFSVGLPAIVEAARQGRLLDVLAQGGIVFYGGLLGGILGAWLGCRIVGLRFLPVLDLCAPPLALGHAFGRGGCLFAGCCYGMPCDLPFCFPLSPYIAGGARLLPVQLIESVCDLILCAALLRYLRKERPVPRAAGIFLMSYAVYRFILEFFRGDEIRGHILGLTTSQFWSLPAFAAGALLCFVLARRGVSADPFRTPEGRIRHREADE